MRKKNHGKGGFQQRGRQNYPDRNIPVIPQNYTLLISNYYPEDRPPDAVLEMLKKLAFESFGGSPDFSSPLKCEGGFMVSVLNHIQYDALLQLNGALVYNYPIWIIKFPSNDTLAMHFPVFTNIFMKSSEGQVDLSNFANKVNEEHGRPEIVNFNNREFVEFLLYRLGVDSRDKKFWVSSLILCNNGIQNINPWASFFHFLPNLKHININNNPLFEAPNLPEYMQIQVEYNSNNFQRFPDNGFRHEYPTPDEMMDMPTVPIEEGFV